MTKAKHRPKTVQETARVIENAIECAGHFRLGLATQGHYADALPGQFVMVRMPGRLSPLLGRPFSIHRKIEENGGFTGIQILYKVVGEGTELLTGLRAGDRVELLGPLGNGFTLPEGARRVFIAAGGIGVAPVYFLVRHLLENGIARDGCTLFLGGQSENDLLCIDDFMNVGVESLHFTTDDGSFGERALVTAPLVRALEEKAPDIIYACGPHPMLRAVAEIAEARNIPCQISIESRMACGVGACLGCAVRPRGAEGGYRHVCSDGPVFDARSVLL